MPLSIFKYNFFILKFKLNPYILYITALYGK